MTRLEAHPLPPPLISYLFKLVNLNMLRKLGGGGIYLNYGKELTPPLRMEMLVREISLPI